MSDDSGPSTSTTSRNELISSDLPTTSSTSTPTAQQDEEVTSTSTSCWNASTRKFASIPYGAFMFISGVVFLVAANVNTDEHGIDISGTPVPVYRYLTVVLLIAILWMATFIASKAFSRDCCLKWFPNQMESAHPLVPTRLLVGVMFFGLGSSFMTMVELLEYVAEYDCPSKDLSMLFYYVVRTIFIYVQLYFFYKLSCNSEKLLLWSHLLIMHLIAVNLLTWIVTFVYDSAEELYEDPDPSRINDTAKSNSTRSFMARHWGVLLEPWKNMNKSEEVGCKETAEVLQSTAKMMEPFLYTFTMEYCLISAGLLLNAWLSLRTSLTGEETGAETQHKNDDNQGQERDPKKVAKRDHDGHKRDHEGHKRDHEGQNGDLKRKKRDSRGRSNYEIIESDDDEWVLLEKPESMPEAGTLWRFGFILGLSYVPAFVAIVFNLIFSDHNYLEEDQLIYIGGQFFFFLSILIASLIGIRQLDKQHKGKTHSLVDFTLLGVSLVGVFFLDLLIILAAICESGASATKSGFLVVTNITELLCSVAFTLFVRKALEHELPDLPGERDEAVRISATRIREVVSFLFMLNICVWAMYTFEVKKSALIIDIVEQFYTKHVWFYLSHFVYPLAIFFHFHGAVCMMEILNHYSISKPKTISNSVSMSLSHPVV